MAESSRFHLDSAFLLEGAVNGGGGLYATLEAESGFGDERVCGRFMGGLGTVQVVR